MACFFVLESLQHIFRGGLILVRGVVFKRNYLFARNLSRKVGTNSESLCEELTGSILPGLCERLRVMVQVEEVIQKRENQDY
jgi:hypothetical protein